MKLNRREFFECSGAGAAICSIAAARSTPVHHKDARASVIERRIYSQQSVLPPADLMNRYGIRTVSIKKKLAGMEYLIPFDSLEARARAWDGFNSDAEWGALRGSGQVEVSEIQLGAAGA